MNTFSGYLTLGKSREWGWEWRKQERNWIEWDTKYWTEIFFAVICVATFTFSLKCLHSQLCFTLVILCYNAHLLFALMNGYLLWFTFSNIDAILTSSENTDCRKWNVKYISLYVQGFQMPVLEVAKCWAEKWELLITL